MLLKLFHSVIEWFIGGIPGGLGQRVRYGYYRHRFASCGSNVRIDEWVVFQNPENMIIGNDVWIFSHAILTAPADRQVGLSTNKSVINADIADGQLRIGNEVQVGLFSILNGTGGLEIGDCATLSARVSLYSATHLPYDPQDRSLSVGCNGMVRSRPVFSQSRPMRIGAGAWLGVGCTVICASVGDDAFVKSGIVISRDVPQNTEVGQQCRTYTCVRFSSGRETASPDSRASEAECR
jgi:acetyltransferase-like isoleucine patch superfamily enzyme